MVQINPTLSNRDHWKLKNAVECVLCGSILPEAAQAQNNVLMYTWLIHALSFRLFLWMGNILPLIKWPIAISCSYFKLYQHPDKPKVHQVSVISYKLQLLPACWTSAQLEAASLFNSVTSGEQNSRVASTACGCSVSFG